MNRIPVLATTLLTLAAAAVTTTPIAAQSLTRGELGGVVQSVTGAGLSDVQLTLERMEGGVPVILETGRDGVFLLPLLPAGEYRLLAERLGYRPVVLEPIPVRPDRRVDVRVTLEAVEGGVEAPERVRFEGGALAGGSRPGRSHYFGEHGIRTLPAREGELTEVLRTSSLGEPSLEVEGLPPALSGMAVGGVPFTPARHGAAGSAMTSMLLPLRTAGGAELMAGRPDMGGPSTAGGLLSMVLRSAPAGCGGVVEGRGGGGDPSVTRGGALLGGSLVGDSAHGWVFAEAQRRSVPVRFWPADAGELAADLWEEGSGLDVASLDTDALSDAERLNAGGSFDWQLADNRSVEIFALYGRAEAGHSPGALTGAPVPTLAEGEDLMAGVTAVARLTDGLDAQLRAGLTRSGRSYGQAATLSTGLGEAAVAFGPTWAQIGDPGYPATVDRSELSAEGTLYYRSGAHQLKGGIGGRFTSHEQTSGDRGLYLFSDAPSFADRRGAFQGAAGARAASFSVAEAFVYGQDSWRVAPGLELTSGLSYEIETLPAGDLVPNRRWQELTGIDNTNVPGQSGDVGLVVGFDWDVQERQVWGVRGALTIQRGDIAPALLAEALTHDGRVEASAAVGDVTAPVMLGPRLTILSPGLTPPLTTRGSLGLSRAIGRSAALHLGAVVRQTDNLPRRTDLNRPANAPYRDQHGRPVLGTLVREGGLLFAEPGSNRQFGEFDAVSVISGQASSSYWGVTAGLEKHVGALQASAFYTHSATEDDWVGAAAGTPLDALAPYGGDSVLDGWAQGTSDFDVPQRMTANAVLTLPFAPGIRIGGTWHRASGRPFTAGFGPGIDANGDGVAGNDPAFIDGAVAGMDELMATHECLREQEGQFAERNGCRAETRSLLDAWVGLRLPVAGIVPELRVEALALTSSGVGPVDPALYHLDPDGAIVSDPLTGELTVPLAVNPRFGSPLQSASEQTRVRISLRMVF